MKIAEYLKKKQKLINAQLKILIPANNNFPPKIHEAMNYCITGGKRIRPILCIESCRICGGRENGALLAACAIEMIHTYSLIHDDLPAMDNDDYRRGRLTCHKKFDEAIAILAGDAFNTLAYKILADAATNPIINNHIIKEIAEATGTFGMIGGQIVDIGMQKTKDRGQTIERNLPTIEYINTHKTGTLIAISCKTGAIIAGASKKQEEAIFRYGEYIGFAFQIIDDVLDSEGLAKIFGRKEAYSKAKALINKAKEQLSVFKKGKRPLLELADFILERKV